jgi:hypothetical protein
MGFYLGITVSNRVLGCSLSLDDEVGPIDYHWQSRPSVWPVDWLTPKD